MKLLLSPKRQLYKTARVLFKVRDCSMCRKYSEFIGRINTNLPMDRRIIIVDCTDAYDYGIEESLFKIFKPYLKEGIFPVLFLDGTRLDGSNSREEVEAYLRAFLRNDFILEQNNPYIREMNCYVKKKFLGLKNQVVCEDA